MTDFYFPVDAPALTPVRADRVLPDPSSTGVRSDGEITNFNLFFIVGFALLITVLARFLSTRGRKK